MDGALLAGAECTSDCSSGYTGASCGSCDTAAGYVAADANDYTYCRKFPARAALDPGPPAFSPGVTATSPPPALPPPAPLELLPPSATTDQAALGKNAAIGVAAALAIVALVAVMVALYRRRRACQYVYALSPL